LLDVGMSEGFYGHSGSPVGIMRVSSEQKLDTQMSYGGSDALKQF